MVVLRFEVDWALVSDCEDDCVRAGLRVIPELSYCEAVRIRRVLRKSVAVLSGLCVGPGEVVAVVFTSPVVQAHFTAPAGVPLPEWTLKPCEGWFRVAPIRHVTGTHRREVGSEFEVSHGREKPAGR